MKFEGQHPDEKVIFILRKHPAVLFRPSLWITLITLLPIFAFIYFKFSWVFSYTFFLWLILAGIYTFKAWYCYKNSQYILTDKRLINIDQKGIFYKTVSEAPVDKIQDVSFEIRGFWSSMFEFGTIYVQTAGTQEKFALKCVDEPRKVQAQILEGLGKVLVGEKEKAPVVEEKAKVEQKKPKRPLDIKRNKEADNFWD